MPSSGGAATTGWLLGGGWLVVGDAADPADGGGAGAAAAVGEVFFSAVEVGGTGEGAARSLWSMIHPTTAMIVATAAPADISAAAWPVTTLHG